MILYIAISEHKINWQQGNIYVQYEMRSTKSGNDILFFMDARYPFQE